ncbi:hypothetical protein LEP1GSC117_2546 [Leptospira interrogans serovar Icterohaemorrhagiae str. Verdun LP]|nr:hypothetical protein LEP1GSC117_2546 [Leptospira interrogans serovar Icterohaemorrhagiae str. Verdun LP]
MVHILSSIIWLEEKSQMDKEAAQVVSIKRLLFQKAIGFEMLRFYLDENAN